MFGEAGARPEVLAALVQALLGDADANVGLVAGQTLGMLGEEGARPEVVAALVQAVLGDPHASVRGSAADALGRLGEAGGRPEVVSALVQGRPTWRNCHCHSSMITPRACDRVHEEPLAPIRSASPPTSS